MEGLDLSTLFDGCYGGRKVLVTGHTGFKGSWLCLWLRALGADVTGIALDPEAHPCHWQLLALEGVRDLRIDINDALNLRHAVASIKPEIVFHLAAQPLVRRSYRSPEETFATNVIGLVNLLEALRDCDSARAVINATTDKVYAEQDNTLGYREDHPLGGHDPYSTSKACAELVTDCYRKSFFSGAGRQTLLATARAGNVIGGGDWSEDRLVPDLVRAAVAGRPLRIRSPEAVRPWQHVLEPLSGYLRIGQALLNAESDAEGAWNLGPAPDATLCVQELVDATQQHWPGVEHQLDPGPHPHEASVLRLDCSRAYQALKWRPVWGAEVTVQRTITWYRQFYERQHLGSFDDLNQYMSDAKAAGVGWAA